MRVLITANAFAESGDAALGPLRDAGLEIVLPPRMGPLPADELVHWLGDAAAVVAATDPYVPEVLDRTPHLRVIARWGVGYDTVDVAAATARGIVVTNTPGANTETVADFVFGLVLSAARRLPEGFALMRAGGWAEVRGVDVWRKTLGIVGFGAIGQAVARRARGFEMRVLAYDPYQPHETFAAYGVESVNLQEIWSDADFVSLHASLSGDTRHLIGEAELRAMKPSAHLINAARGGLVNTDALVTALREGWIDGAALDVYEDEPLSPDHPLRTLPNCVLTPHSAFNSAETAARTNAMVNHDLLAVLSGEPPLHAVNPEVLVHPAFEQRAQFAQGAVSSPKR